jgi:hypothetical protein
MDLFPHLVDQSNDPYPLLIPTSSCHLPGQKTAQDRWASSQCLSSNTG